MRPGNHRTTITNVAVVSMDEQVGELESAVIEVEDGTIAQVRPATAVTEGGAGDGREGEVIDGRGLLALPGFVDTHRHTWQSAIKHSYAELDPRVYFAEVLRAIGASYEPDDVYAGNLLGGYAALSSGTTTLFDWSHVQNSPAHSDAAIAGLRESGIRAVFGHGWPTSPDDRWTRPDGEEPHPADIRRIQREYFADGPLDGRISLALAARGPEEASRRVWEGELALARELGLRVSVHVGAYAAHAGSEAVRQYAEAGLLGPDMTFVHCNHLTDDELQRIADCGATVSLGVHCEMNSQGIGEIPFFRLLQRGIRPSLSGDTETKCTGDMFTQMRMLWAYYRSTLTRVGEADAARLKRVTMRDILGFATLEGARAVGLASEIGSLAPGKRADIILLRADALNLGPVQDPVASVVLAAHEGNVEHVMVGGRFVKRDGAMTGADPGSLVARARGSQRRILDRAARLKASRVP
jgi:cytosine/adenosine deaminase-related metal-dependent hydrolase